ncbi:hypothetical protein E2562_019117 [Oryza meyeriana var. granulata]|uniref:Uncharacterized protein n=1 Tax=Oryza meyeriana var. granulata TaxID=110450 RepID=A0A6G1CQN2_9ORYZ|nr:hypothetical protein E2562_019117 [Oryza meyeriana var. granulata]
MGEEQRRSPVAAALLVLVACNLTLALSRLTPPPSAHDNAARVEPVGYLASMASSVLAVYVAASAAACHGRRRGRLFVEAVLWKVRRTWTRPAMTALYVELLTTAMASLLLTLRAFLGAATGGGAGAELLAVSGSVALVGWLGPVLFAHSDIACRMSLVVAAVEEGYEGRAAVDRAEALVTGRRARGIAIAFAAGLIEQAPSRWCGDVAPAFVVVPAVLAAKLASCYSCAAFYYQCRTRHDGKNTNILKLQGVTKCCEACWDREVSMVDEAEADAMDSVLGCFRLT